jgi:hypothetical protein
MFSRVFPYALRIVGLIVSLAVWPSLPQLAEVDVEPQIVEPQIKGGQSIAREGRWSIFRMGETPSRLKCVALHRSNVAAILYADALTVEYLEQPRRGPVIAYSVQVDDRALGAPKSPWIDPWVIGLDTSEFRRVVGAKRLRINVATNTGRILDDLDLTGIQAAVGILASEQCQ